MMWTGTNVQSVFLSRFEHSTFQVEDGSDTALDSSLGVKRQGKGVRFRTGLSLLTIQGGPEVGTQYIVYCLPTFGPLCTFSVDSDKNSACVEGNF